MRWEDERYVRFYTRNTPEWLAMSWQARGLFGLILREVDRAGILKVGKLGLKGVAVAISAVWADIEGPLAEILEDGCLRFDASLQCVFMPNFLEAQECAQSDRARKRESRARAVASFGGPEVTNRDDASQNVTESHVRSHAVTPGHSVLCRAVPSQAESESARAPEPAGEPKVESETRMVIAVAAVRPSLAPIPRPIDPALELTDEARATAEMRGLRDVDAVWISFVGHCIGRGILSCDFLAGDWPKWVSMELTIQRRQRDRDAQGARRSGPSGRSPADENYTPPPVTRPAKPELARGDFERIGVTLAEAGIADDAPLYGTAKTHPRKRAM